MNSNLAYREEAQEERIDGKTVMMSSPTLNHIFIAGNIYRLFGAYLDHKACTPLPDGATLYLDEKNEFKPDMMVVCDPEKLRRKGVYGAPDLVVEILSPSTARYDRGLKMAAYARSGVREYWIVDPANRTLEQYALADGCFALLDVYAHLAPAELSELTAAEREDFTAEFQCKIFDELTIRLDDVFDRVQ